MVVRGGVVSYGVVARLEEDDSILVRAYDVVSYGVIAAGIVDELDSNPLVRGGVVSYGVVAGIKEFDSITVV